MNLYTTIQIYAGGPGSGCNPAVGTCGRHPSGNQTSDFDIFNKNQCSNLYHEIKNWKYDESTTWGKDASTEQSNIIGMVEGASFPEEYKGQWKDDEVGFKEENSVVPRLHTVRSDSGKLLGVAYYQVSSDTLQVGHVAVTPDAIGTNRTIKNAGSQIASELEKVAVKSGAKKITLDSLEGASKFWERQGFVQNKNNRFYEKAVN